MTYSSDRLDRIEAILATVAESQARTEANLEGTRQLVESNAAGLRETRQITDSNARAIEAWGARIEDVQVDTEEATSSTRADLAVRIEDNAHNQGIDRVRFDQLHDEHSQRFETLLEEARADRAEMRAAREQWQLEAQVNTTEHQEWRQRFDEQLASNTTEHRAFTQNSQVLLAEIARLWQRMAG
jgi:hypothetical protein